MLKSCVMIHCIHEMNTLCRLRVISPSRGKMPDILPRLAVVAGCLFIAFLIGWHSSPEAEPAGYSITDRVPPAINLVLGISARNALWIITSIALEWIIVDQSLLEGTTSCLDDLDRPTLPAAHSGLLLLSLHPLLQF